MRSVFLASVVLATAATEAFSQEELIALNFTDGAIAADGLGSGNISPENPSGFPFQEFGDAGILNAQLQQVVPAGSTGFQGAGGAGTQGNDVPFLLVLNYAGGSSSDPFQVALNFRVTQRGDVLSGGFIHDPQADPPTFPTDSFPSANTLPAGFQPIYFLSADATRVTDELSGRPGANINAASTGVLEFLNALYAERGVNLGSVPSGAGCGSRSTGGGGSTLVQCNINPIDAIVDLGGSADPLRSLGETVGVEEFANLASPDDYTRRQDGSTPLRDRSRPVAGDQLIPLAYGNSSRVEATASTSVAQFNDGAIGARISGLTLSGTGLSRNTIGARAYGNRSVTRLVVQ